MTKIDIISGFLGAGKTTLIKKLIAEELHDENIVIIENEFGEIGIDGGFLKESGIKVTEMNSGCICCSLVGDFGKALHQVIDEFNPDRVIIEPSGVGKLSDVIKAVNDLHSNSLLLNSYSTIVDAGKCKLYHKNFGEFFNNQIESAATVILSRTSNITEHKLETALKIIKELNPNALIITTDWSKISGSKLLKAIENGKKELNNIDHYDHEHDEHCTCGCHNHDHIEHEHHHEHDEHCTCGCHDHDHIEHEHHHEHDEHCTCGCHDHDHHHHHHADEVFESIAIQTANKYSKDQIENILNQLMDNEKYGTVLRSKGIIESNKNDWIHFDYVPGEIEIRDGEPDVTGKICVIGSKLNKEEINNLFSTL